MKMETKIPGRLKQLRNRKKLTLQQLAQKAGCTKSYICQLEKGTSSPSISMLGRLAEALEIPVADLIRDEGDEERGNWHLLKADRRTINYPDGKVTSQLLTKGVFQKKMQPLLSVIEPGGMLNNSGKMSHPKGAEEFVLVLKGEIEFEIGSKIISLQDGDTLYFDGDLPHRWMNIGKETAEVLFVWTPPVW
jgi:transcriptional regulator with XRE-family HTH domain